MPYWRLFYHATWATKQRHPLIDLQWESSLHNVIAAKGRTLGAHVFAVGGIEDHIHLVAAVPPSLALSTFLGQIKGNSSHFVNRALSVPYEFGWQSEFGIVSFGGRQLDTVVRYVRNQRQHHAAQTLIPFLEQNEQLPGPRE